MENKRFATKTISGPVYIEIDTTLAPTEAGTRGTSFYRGESRSFFKFAEPLVVPTDEEALRDRRRKTCGRSWKTAHSPESGTAWYTISQIIVYRDQPGKSYRVVKVSRQNISIEPGGNYARSARRRMVAAGGSPSWPRRPAAFEPDAFEPAS